MTLLVIDLPNPEVQSNVNLCLLLFATQPVCQAAEPRLRARILTQGCFMVGVKHESKLMPSRGKSIDPVGIPLLGVLRYQSVNFVLQASEDLRADPWRQGVIVSKQLPDSNAKLQARELVANAIYLISHRVKIWHKTVLRWEPRTNRNTYGKCKNSWPRQHTPFGSSQVLINKLNLAIRQRPGGGPLRPRCYVHKTTTWHKYQETWSLT